MPKLSDDTLLQRAIGPACMERESFADACSNVPADASAAITEMTKIAALKGRCFSELSAEDDEVARLAFIYAELWEASISDSCPGTVQAKTAGKAAKLFREIRIKRWGHTKREAYCSQAKKVSVFDLLSGKAGF